MVTQGQQQLTSWKEKAIQNAEGISDAWEVVKEYLGRAAEWILFACMLANIIQMLPGINLPEMLTNAVMGTQVIMLDIGGFALASMAERAREQGHEEAADKAATTAKFLIGLMILTLLFVAIGNLFPAYKSYTGMAEKCLILVRVVMTVVYGHVIHGMRKFSHTPNQHQAQPASYDLDAMKAAIIHEARATTTHNWRRPLPHTLLHKLRPLSRARSRPLLPARSRPLLQGQWPRRSRPGPRARSRPGPLSS